MDRILTIAIPTYNRPEQIQIQVRLLLPQLNERVDLVVIDNCSTIPVKDLFTNDELSKFSLIHNRVNIGADGNIARCFETCSTPWLWTLSDDDFVKSNAIETVLAQITQNPEAVFLCFWSDHYFKTVGFEDLANKFRSAKIFGISFSMSFCAYNMSKLQKSMEDYYINLSSMVGSIILVLKYVQANDEVVCVFTNNPPIKAYDSEVGWNYADFIRRSRMFVEAFGRKNRRKYQKTLFLGYYKINYSLLIINRKGSNLTYAQRWNSYFQVIHNQGLINAILYTPKQVLVVFIYLIMQHKWLHWIVDLTKLLLGRKKNQDYEPIKHTKS